MISALYWLFVLCLLVIVLVLVGLFIDVLAKTNLVASAIKWVKRRFARGRSVHDGYSAPPPERRFNNESQFGNGDLRVLRQDTRAVKTDLAEFKARALEELKVLNGNQVRILQLLSRLEEPSKGRDDWDRREVSSQSTSRGSGSLSKSERKKQRGQSGALEKSSGGDSQFRDLCDFYNSVGNDPVRRRQFRERYRFIRIGTSNAMQRFKDLSLDPEFRRDDDGDFCALELGGGVRPQFAVIPSIGVVLNDSSYGPGAIGVVFDCHGFSSGYRYREVKLVRPALFILDAGQNWLLEEPGELDIGHPESQGRR